MRKTNFLIRDYEFKKHIPTKPKKPLTATYLQELLINYE